MIEEVLHEQRANVLGALQLELRVAGSQGRQHHLGQDVRGGRDQVEPADAAEVRLEELEALLPVRRPEVDGRVVAADDRVLLAHRRRPVAAEPGLLAGRQGQDRPHVRIGEVQLREALEGAVERERDRPHVGELVGQGGDRGGENADGLLDLVAQVDEALGARAPLDLPEQGAAARPRGCWCIACWTRAASRAPARPVSSDRRQHGTQPSTEPRFGTIADRMSADAAYLELLHRAREHTLLGSCATLLEWDEDVHMPEGGAEHRAEQQALLARLLHVQATDPRLGDLLAEAEARLPPRLAPGDPAAVNLRELREEYEKARLVPASLVEELARVTTLSYEAWRSAREQRDARTFLPWLARVVALKQAEADCLARGRDRYDVLLDEWEPGLTWATLGPMLARLRAAVGPLLDRAIGRSGPLPAVPDAPGGRPPPGRGGARARRVARLRLRVRPARRGGASVDDPRRPG